MQLNYHDIDTFDAHYESEEHQYNSKASLDDETRPFDFLIRENCYYSIDAKKKEIKRISNFILEPLLHLMDNENGLWFFRIINNKNESMVIEFHDSQLSSLSAFKTRLRSSGSYIWKTKIEKLDNILEYCFDLTKSAYQVDVMGYNRKHGIYAFGNGILFRGEFLKADRMGIVKTPDGRNFFLKAMSDIFADDDDSSYQFARMFIHTENECAMTMREFVDGVTGLFGTYGKIGYCFLLASHFRDVACREYDGFPILNLFGEKGTGKTTLATILQSFFMRVRKPDTLSAMTISNIKNAMTPAVNFMTVIDDYKNEVSPQKIDFLKSIFDNSGQSMKKMNGDKKENLSEITAALTLCGRDMPTQDMALFSRLIPLHLRQTDFSPSSQCELIAFRDRCLHGNTHLAIEVLRHREYYEQQFPGLLRLTRDDLTEMSGRKVMAPLLNSWATVLAALRTLETRLDIGLKYADLLPEAVELMNRQDSRLNDNSEMSDFWNSFQGLFVQGKIVDKAHFKIKYDTQFKPMKCKRDGRIFDSPHPILYLNTEAVSILFGRSPGASSTANRCNRNTILTYLKSEPYYLGKKQDRFMILRPNGEPDYEYAGSGTTLTRRSRHVRTIALCFDYRILHEKHGLDIET